MPNLTADGCALPQPPEYGFGTPLYGSCGYLSQAGTEGVSFADVPFPVDTLAAAANINADYPGSCGRLVACCLHPCAYSPIPFASQGPSEKALLL